MGTVLKFGAAALAGVVAGSVGVIAFATQSLVHDTAGSHHAPQQHPRHAARRTARHPRHAPATRTARSRGHLRLVVG